MESPMGDEEKKFKEFIPLLRRQVFPLTKRKVPARQYAFWRGKRIQNCYECF